MFCSVGKACDGNQSRKYNTDLPLVNSELEHGVDAITASGNGDSEVEKQTAKSAVWNLLGYNNFNGKSMDTTYRNISSYRDIL